MRITPPADTMAIPDDYESCDIVSINYRHFSVWLKSQVVETLKGVVTEVRFPWSQTVNADNYRTRLNRLPEYALEAMELLQSTVQTDTCRIISCEADKFCCTLALVAPLPQVVYQGLQSMPCPDLFAMPHMENLDKSAAEYVFEHRQRHEH